MGDCKVQDNSVLQLIFHLAHWHGLAKLRLHSDLSLNLLDTETTCLGEQLRCFKDKVCPAFETRELKREADSRRQKATKKQFPIPVTTTRCTKSTARPAPIIPEVDQPRAVPDDRAWKAFSLDTYKVHALGDYPQTIRRYGTTDSYSTEPVSSTHNVYLSKIC